MKTGGSLASGFTVVETLIVLAVTGFLFVGAATIISGKQAKTQFSVSIQSAMQQMQEVINETASGNIPSKGDFTCIPGNPPRLTNSGGPNNQGSNSGCMFMGKVVRMSNTSSTYDILSLVGNSKVSGREVNSLDDTKVQVIAPALTQPGFSRDTTEQRPVGGGLDVDDLWYDRAVGGGSIHAAAFGLLPALNEVSYTDGQLDSGAQRLSLYGLQSTSLSDDRATVIEKVNFAPPSTPTKLERADKVYICLNGTASGQSGLITIDGDSGSLTVNVKIFNNLGC